MLQSIRDRLTGPIVWFVIGLICIPFAIFGVESFRSSGGSEPIMAKVGKHEITRQEYTSGYERYYQQLQAYMGENFRPEMIDRDQAGKTVLNGLVERWALQQYAKDTGLSTTDAALYDYLTAVPAFQDDGKFSSERYRELLKSRGLKEATFEAEQRQMLTVEQLRSGILDTAFVTPADAQLAYRLSAQTRDASVAVLAASQYLDKVTVGDDKVVARYEERKASYKAPERIKLAYVELDAGDLSKAASPGADVLKVLYDAEKDSRFTIAEQRKARHILVSFGADKSAAKKKIESLAQQLQSGGDFAALAKANSDDPGSKDQGGDLGWVKRGAMVKPFEDALFELKQGETSKPVETEFGWHVIHLDELKPAGTKAFDDAEVQADLLTLYQQRESEKHYQEQAEKIEQLAFENPASLEPVAQALGLQVKTTDWFSRTGGAGIASNAAVQQAAFSTEVLTDNENSKPLSLGADHLVVIRKAEYEAPRQRTLDEVKESVLSELKAEAAKALSQEKSKALLAAVKGGQDFEAAAEAAGTVVSFNGALTRQQAGLDRQVLDAVFKAPRPAKDQPALTTVSLANGDQAVIQLRAVNDPTESGAAQAQSSTLKQSLAGAEYASLRKSIEDELKVKIVTQPSDAAKAEEAAQ